jgi:hypothetical protein
MAQNVPVQTGTVSGTARCFFLEPQRRFRILARKTLGKRMVGVRRFASQCKAMANPGSGQDTRILKGGQHSGEDFAG